MKAFNPIHVLLPLLLLAARAVAAEQSSLVNLPDQLTRLGWQQIELRRTGDNHLFVFGRLNGRQRSVLVDTGWSFTTVSTNAARQLKTHRELGVTLHDPFFGTNENSSVVLLESLKLGRIEFTHQPALMQNMVLNGQRAPFDVVLGCDFLMRNFCVIDCPDSRLYVRSAAPSEQQQREFEEALRLGGFVAVQLNARNRSRLLVQRS